MVGAFSIYNPSHASSFGRQPNYSDQQYGFQSPLEAYGVVKAENAFTTLYSGTSMSCGPPYDNQQFSVFYSDIKSSKFCFPIFLLEVSVVVIITRLVRYCLKPLKQPRIISEILGGIIIGPSVLGRNKDFSTFMYPENAYFVIKNVGLIGFMYFLFVAGVKMDLGLVKKSGKKELYISFMGFVVPLIAVTGVGFFFRESMDKDLAKFTSIGAISSALAITSFPVLHPVLQELNLLSSEVGKMALSTAIIGDAIAINVVVAFEASLQGENNPRNALWYLISSTCLVTFVAVVVRRGMEWIAEKTPEGKPVKQNFIVWIFLAVLALGFLTDFFGVAICNGPLWLGLIIPDGPPLGSTLVEKSDTLVSEILLPFSYATVGLLTDVPAMTSDGWSKLMPLFAMALTGYLSKFVAMLGTALYFQMPVRDSFTLSLILSLRGQVELILFIHWLDKKIVKAPGFTLMVLLTTLFTAVCSPLISILYDPTRPYMANKRRTIQHTAPGAELDIVVCIHDPESLGGLITVVDASNASTNSPFSIYALRLIELVGRATPIFIDHKTQEAPPQYSGDTIYNALERYQEIRGEAVKIHSYTSVAPRRTMYQDICELALRRKATFVILPFSKECLKNHGGIRSVNSDVLAHAPCSVGILVDKGYFHAPLLPGFPYFRNNVYHFAILFLGGADAREALSLADRMVGNPDVCLTVIRFLSHNSKGDDELEKKLDDGVVTSFWVKNERNERVEYKEVVVEDGSQTVAAIRALNEETFDLWIVGKKHGINPQLLEGLSHWSENHELGMIGDYVSSLDFGSTASVLVVQQQVLREQRKLCSGFFSDGRITCCIY